jgi:hypothetical protein
VKGFSMQEEQHRFLMQLGQLPARLSAEQAAWVLNCQTHDIPPLIAATLLKPLGNPTANSFKYFATADLLEQMKDRNRLVRVTNTIYTHWQGRNAYLRNRGEAGQLNGWTPSE